MGVLFSIIIPLYNKEMYIKKCIRSVLEQTYENFEVIIIDDGSSDSSVEIVKSFDDKRIKLFQKQNGGVSSARNKGIELARGEVIAFLDADDWFENDYLFQIKITMDKSPNCDAYSSAYNKYVNGKNIQRSPLPRMLRSNEEFVIIKDFYTEWARGAFFFTSSIAVRSEYFLKHNLIFPINENMGEDQEVWFHLADHGKICHINKRLSNYRIASENSLTFNNKLNVELPFITRFKKRIESEERDGLNVVSKRIFLNKYNLELSVNNAKSGYKKNALKLLLGNMSFRHRYLVLLSISLLILPNSFIKILKTLLRNLKN